MVQVNELDRTRRGDTYIYRVRIAIPVTSETKGKTDDIKELEFEIAEVRDPCKLSSSSSSLSSLFAEQLQQDLQSIANGGELLQE